MKAQNRKQLLPCKKKKVTNVKKNISDYIFLTRPIIHGEAS